MSKSAAKVAVVLALSTAGALACEKREEPMRTGETRTTSGTMEETSKATSDADRRLSDERASTEAAKADAARERARADACEAKETARSDKAKAAAKAKTATHAKAKEEKTAKETREGGEEAERAKPHVTVGEHVGRATITSAPGRVEETNDSTTLGTGTSGMYTGGKGTYGGQATWGSGGGAGTAAPAPSAPPNK